MPRTRSGSGDIYFEEHGTGFPLMLVPGLGGIGSYWQPQIEAFSRNFRVVIHDHRGTGRSARSNIRYSIRQMADDALSVMDELRIEKTHILGHSTGGAIAQVLLTEHPDRFESAVLYATWPKADVFFRRCFEIRRHLLHSCGMEAYVRGASLFVYPNWWIRDNESAEVGADTTVYGTEAVSEIVDSRIQALLDFDWEDRLSEISARCLVLGVENDNLTPAYFSRRIAELIPDSVLAILPDGGHAASHVLPAEFNRTVLSFLEGLSADTEPRKNLALG